MGSLQRPENFNMKDLYLEVQLKTCIDGTSYDFTGRKTFDTSFYRKNIGFGITDIGIEINPSLQPSIEITFKDLYGNTLFGTQRGSDDEIDTSVLFNWPPPKFIFSFKGFLGRKVTWMLNLKTTNVSYVPSDGSYEIKCSFVPNQWGFFADIPVLYLLACKKLRTELYQGKNQIEIGKSTPPCIFKTDSVFSYTRIGKQVESKTTEETKQFDTLSKQLSSMRYGTANAMFNSKILNLNEPIKGIVNNIPIKGFTNLKIDTSSSADRLDFNSMANLAVDTKNTKQLDAYLQINVKKGKDATPTDDAFTNYIISPRVPTPYSEINPAGDKTKTAGYDLMIDRSKVFTVIDANIKLIDDEIKRRVYASTKKEIGKLTIGEVFQQIARDAGFILGSILQAGFDGYENNKTQRDNAQALKDDLIGNCFPLYINEEGEEIPAMNPLNSKKHGPKHEYGVKDYEMKFVDKFIEAIGEGIAENLIEDEIAGAGEDKIKNRINNLEALQPNPYKPFYTNIAENILIRSGVIAYVTRSEDPSVPGDYHTTWQVDRDSDESMITIANNDMENLTKGILSQLSYVDKADLIRFCRFFDKLICDDGDGDGNGGSGTVDIGRYFLKPYEATANPNFMLWKEGVPGKLLAYNQPISDDVLDYRVIIDDYTSANLKQDYEIFSQNGANSQANNYSEVKVFTDKVLATDRVTDRSTLISVSLRELLQNSGIIKSGETIVPMQSAEADFPPSTFYNVSRINPATLTATNIRNNNTYYCMPLAQNNKYYFVLYDNSSDVSDVATISVDDATSDEDIEGEGWFTLKSNEPIGFVNISTPVDKDNKILHKINLINDAIADKRVLNYSKCKNFYNDYSDYLQTQLIQKQKTLVTGELAAKNLAYAVYTHTQADVSDDSRNLVFGPFCSGIRAENQRIVIKTMVKAILKKFDEIDTEKNELLSSILGKANESRDLIYKQMHTIFQQWQIIASSIQGGKDLCTKYVKTGSEHLALLLEKEYGSCQSHKERGTGTEPLGSIPLEGNTLFVYDYPLAPVNGTKIDVKKSIINIEPLYKPNGNTTILNIIQQICTKNNFIFVPFPGDANSDNINDIYKPTESNPSDEKIRNYFHVLFAPTPETRSKLKNETNEYTTDYMHSSTNFKNNAISISFGAVNNQIIKSINVGTDSTKPTAESILNLQRLVDKENTNKKVGMDCSMLPVYEGRSYKTSIDMIGNSQVYPMQYFFIENMPMFGGLYQIMKVSHSISPNNMTTKVDGIRMRFSTNGTYGGIPPITTDSLDELGAVEQPMVGTQTPTNALGAITTIQASVVDIAVGTGGNSASASPYIGTPTNSGPQLVQSVNLFDTTALPHSVAQDNTGTNLTLVTYRGWTIREDVAKSLISMVLSMEADGLKIKWISGFRSHENQVATFKENKCTVNGQQWDFADATAKSMGKIVCIRAMTARPGNSNHGLGLAYDINTGDLGFPGVGGTRKGVIKDLVLYKWLIANAYKYGFKRMVSSEPWHWEYRPGSYVFSGVKRDHESWYEIPDQLANEGHVEFTKVYI